MGEFKKPLVISDEELITKAKEFLDSCNADELISVCEEMFGIKVKPTDYPEGVDTGWYFTVIPGDNYEDYNGESYFGPIEQFHSEEVQCSKE